MKLKETITPIFIFSMPRSGSTLLQRILMTHDNIVSTSEPWFLLPLFYSTKCQGTLAEYSHHTSAQALQDLIGSLPGKGDEYERLINRFATSVYQSLSLSSSRYFIDKTPRYYLIINEIAKTFPEAKIIFLYRNPAHILSSIIDTWGGGRLRNLHPYHIDFNKGMPALADGYLSLSDRAIKINYEELVTNSKESIQRICSYLDLDYDEGMLENFHQQKMDGRMGDPSGIKKYQQVEKQSMNKWKTVFHTKVRRRLLKSVISNLDSTKLEVHGYSKSKLFREIDMLPDTQKLGIQDAIDVFKSFLIGRLKLNIWFGAEARKWVPKTWLG